MPIPSNDNAEPTKTCRKCGETKPISGFPKNKECLLGVTSTCRACRDARVSAMVPVVSIDARKVCSVCGEEKSVDDFYKQKGGLLGRHSQCKACSVKRASVYAEAHPEERRDAGVAWRAANPERTAELRDDWYAKNPHKKIEYGRKRRSTPHGKLENMVRWRLWNELQPGAKAGRKTFDLLGYTADDLRCHIERLFEPGMSWDNWAHDVWHIDHIRPLSSFSYSTPDDQDFKAAWALSNLQPLWAKENMSKGPKWSPSNDNEVVNNKWPEPMTKPH